MGSQYQSQSATGYNSSPPPDDGSTVASNKITWGTTIKAKLADPIKTLADAINTQLRTALNVTPSTTSIAYTTLVGDHMTTVEATGTFTVSLGDCATMIAQSMGYTVTVYNKGTAIVTVGVITATDTLAGRVNGTVTLPPGAAMTFTAAQSGVGYDIVSATGFAPFVLTGAAGTNTATAASPSNLLALYSGLVVSFTPANTNTGATTLNITPSGGSALGAKNIFIWGRAVTGAELVANIPTLLQYDGTQFNVVGTAIIPSATQTFLLSADVALNNTANYFDVVNTGSIGGAGQTWKITACATVADTGGVANIEVRIWDGTTVYTNTTVTVPASSGTMVVTIVAIVTQSAAATYRLSCKDQTATTGLVKTTGLSGTANKATWILAERLS